MNKDFKDEIKQLKYSDIQTFIENSLLKADEVEEYSPRTTNLIVIKAPTGEEYKIYANSLFVYIYNKPTRYKFKIEIFLDFFNLKSHPTNVEGKNNNEKLWKDEKLNQSKQKNLDMELYILSRKNISSANYEEVYNLGKDMKLSKEQFEKLTLFLKNKSI
jgi:hypothetical protein